MSHFTCLVIGPRNEEELHRALRPFHEFECTGINEFIQEIDQLDEARAEYATDTTDRLQGPDGKLYKPHADRFYRDPTPEETQKIGPIAGTGFGGGMSWTSQDWQDGRGYRTKIRFVPDGFTEVEVKTSDLMTFAQWVDDHYERKLVLPGEAPDMTGEHKYGYIQIGRDGNIERIVKRTNPEKHWDWWALGGRWRGFFKLQGTTALAKAMTVKRRRSLETMAERGTKNEREIARRILGIRTAVLGEAGTGGNDPRYDVDQCEIGEVDVAFMREDASRKAGEEWDKWQAAACDTPPALPWSHFMAEAEAERMTWDAARQAFHAQPRVVAVKTVEKWEVGDAIDALAIGRDAYAARAAADAIRTFAVVKDGKWYERGQMGWWGAIGDEKDSDAWGEEFNRLLDGLPPETVVSIVDCHI